MTSLRLSLNWIALLTILAIVFFFRPGIVTDLVVAVCVVTLFFPIVTEGHSRRYRAARSAGRGGWPQPH